MQLSDEQQQMLDKQKEHCPFCQIISGKIPAKKVYEDDLIIAVLDINPAAKGHCLVMPKEHYPIMPLIPENEFKHLFARVREITTHLRQKLMVQNVTAFIANGQAAGQQSNHFLIHVVPSGEVLPNFRIPSKQLDKEKVQEAGKMLSHNLPLMMRKRANLYPVQQEEVEPSNELAQMIHENPGLRKMIIEKPEAVLAGLEDNPSLKPLFEGVDVFKLSEQLKQIQASEEGSTVAAPSAPQPDPVVEQVVQPEPVAQQHPPQSEQTRAIDMSDDQLSSFLGEKEKLHNLLLNDLETLKAAIEQQPKLQSFFEQTSPEQVLARLQQPDRPSSRFQRTESGDML